VNLIRQQHARYLNDHAFLRLLGEHDIGVLSDFVSEDRVIDDFWDTYYGAGVPRVVVCGLNPGRFGAGQTGIPFMDFASLGQLLPGIARQDHERSAGFFFEVVSAFGVTAFYRTFYVTNVSAVGFVRSGRNLNYPDLPAPALETVKQRFLEEMELVQPTHVIALGHQVQKTLRQWLPAEVDCSRCLAHPAWVATYRPHDSAQWIEHYLTEFDRFFR
jgi:hypothetical protein